MNILATLDTANFADCTKTGYTFTLYSDGHLSAEYHSRWHGSRTGARYITDPGYVDVSAIVDGNPDTDALAKLTSAVQGVSPSEDSAWRQTRRGYIVR